MRKSSGTTLEMVKLLIEGFAVMFLIPLALSLLLCIGRCFPLNLPRRQRFLNMPKEFGMNPAHPVFEVCCILSGMLLSILATVGLIWNILEAVHPSGCSECLVIDNNSAQNTTFAAIQNQSVPENEKMYSVKNRIDDAFILAVLWIPLYPLPSCVVTWALHGLILLGYNELRRENLNRFVDLVLNALDNAWRHFLDLIEGPEDLNRATARENSEMHEKEAIEFDDLLRKCGF
ncbi:hypothetical protein VKT23_012529 [Stygiomarasmius scandens]|uniref:Uncharacterized protein n=1 Tax=Marasmiellus scandens TaxID=2682957 RepID=A0ABR1J825_9AGAR